MLDLGLVCTRAVFKYSGNQASTRAATDLRHVEHGPCSRNCQFREFCDLKISFVCDVLTKVMVLWCFEDVFKVF